MKLEDWLNGHFEEVTEFLEMMRPELEGGKGLHVIGTCGECRHWTLKDIPIPDLGPLNEMTAEYPSHGNCGARDGDSLYDSKDGCIHFEAKGEK